MSINWAAFLAVLVVAYLVPGPDFAVILRLATQTRRSGALAAVGAQTGLCVHMLLAVVGLRAVLVRHPELLTLIRVAGGLYLVWLGASLAWKARNPAGREGPAPTGKGTDRGAFLQGLLTNVTNPKAILFFASVLPQFSSPHASIAGQTLLLGVVDVIFGFLPWAVVVMLGDRLGRRLASVRFQLWRDRTTGAALAGVGGTVVATTRWTRPWDPLADAVAGYVSAAGSTRCGTESAESIDTPDREHVARLQVLQARVQLRTALVAVPVMVSVKIRTAPAASRASC